LRVLAIDTATATGSVALVQDDRVVGEVGFETPSLHSAHVVPAVESVLRDAGVEPAGVEGYAVTIGPGPFTGLRVGISTVQGLGLATGRPVVGISSLDVLAARMRGEGSTLVAMIDAGRGQVYAATYDSGAHPLTAPIVDVPSHFRDWLPEEAAFLGDGALLYRAEIRAARPGSRFPERSPHLAATLGLLAVAQLGTGGGVQPGALRPLYLRGVDLRKPAPALRG